MLSSVLHRQRIALKRRVLPAVTLAVSLVVVAATMFPLGQASAFTPSYNSSNLIDNPTLTDSGTMSAGVIQTFLSNLNSGIKGYSDVEACSAKIAPYYHHCGQRISAAQIIYDAAHAYGINPRAILATMEKEQSLVTDPTPSSSQINCAMGYNSCSGYSGFFTQVDNGTWVLRYNYEGAMRHSTWLAWYPGSGYPCSAKTSLYSTGLYPGNRVTFADPHYSGDPFSTSKPVAVTLANAATASLYCYTPYVGPYSATGYSGSYNFVYYFQLWFGSTQTSVQYAWEGVSQAVYTNSARTQRFDRGNVHAALAPGAIGYAEVTVRNVGYQTWTSSVARLGTSHPNDRCSVFADSTWASCGRINMNESSVVPGDTATFDFDFKAPSTTGSYREYFNMVAEGITWMHGPGLYFNIDVVQPGTAASTDNTLGVGASITPGSHLLSQGLHSTFAMQTDGNLVLYTDGKHYWSSGTHGHTISKLVMQGDGNLVLYGPDGVANWASGTNGNPGAHFVLQSDGNGVIYSSGGTALWSSASNGVPNGLNYVNHSMSSYGSAAVLYIGQRMITANRSYYLVLQGDGNLVLYSHGKAIWASGTNGKPVNNLVMQTDGNLVLYGTNGKALWNTHTAGRGQSNLDLQADGNLVIYDSHGRPSWSSNTSGK